MKKAKEVFSTIQKNFITNDVIDYFESNRFAIELSKGKFLDTEIFGVSVRTFEGELTEEADELSKCFFSLEEAHEHIQYILSLK
ncbi:MAG: hypothetical protein N2043_01625 [Ignavibacterium sp.]|nr:hypothetical protein [Ignavibacterium sp.]